MKYSLFLKRVDKLVQAFCSPRLLTALIFYRVLVGAEHRRIIQSDLNTVVDVGANRGQFSLAIRQWAPKAIIIAFEPLREPAERFRRVFQGDSEVTLYRAAIGSTEGHAIIHVSRRDDSSSLLPIGDRQKSLFPGTEEVRTETVALGRLSDFVSAEVIVTPAMLKLDVQGFELEALRGSEELLRLFSIVYVECSFVELYSGQALAAELISWLWERGFRLNGVYNSVYDRNGLAIQADFLFEKND